MYHGKTHFRQHFIKSTVTKMLYQFRKENKTCVHLAVPSFENKLRICISALLKRPSITLNRFTLKKRYEEGYPPLRLQFAPDTKHSGPMIREYAEMKDRKDRLDLYKGSSLAFSMLLFVQNLSSYMQHHFKYVALLLPALDIKRIIINFKY